MSNLFKDRQSTYPNRYKITDANGNSSYVTLERADEPTVQGTLLNAITLNQLLPEKNGTATGVFTVDGDISLEGDLLLYGSLVRTTPLGIPVEVILEEGIHYGDDLPSAGNTGRIFFKKVKI